MSRGATRLLLLGATVFGLLCALEVLCRVRPEGLAAVAHRVRFKLALLHAKGPVDFVCLGTSRSNDGVAPSLLQLGEGFSAATPSSSLPTLQYQAAHLGPQKLIFVELSRPQSEPTAMDADSTPSRGSFAGDPLGAWLHQHSALLPLRRAFALENWPRVLALLAAGSLDGSEWFRSRQLVELLRSPSPPEGVTDDAAWSPRPEELAPELPALNDDVARVLAGYEAALFALRKGGARVVLVGPPLSSSFRGDECVPEQRHLRSLVARRTGTPLLDFTCAEVDDRWFVDGQHLSSSGRARYSKALGDAFRALP